MPAGERPAPPLAPAAFTPASGPMTQTVRTRFAPSPNGSLHLGHAYSALFAADYARRHGGEFLLRIEDIDVFRTREQHVRGIFDDLAWLGLSWPCPVRFQSRHFTAYCRALSRLKDLGLLYPCTCTRTRLKRAAESSEQGRIDPDGAPLYPGFCRSRSESESLSMPCSGTPWKAGSAAPAPPAWRLHMEKALELALYKTGEQLSWREEGAGPHGEHGRVPADPLRWGDVILGRRDIGVSYHIAVVMDDAEQNITHVTRGQDLFHATAIHRLLQVVLDLPEPVYVHHRLITDEQGRKLSKSAGDTALSTLRATGVTPADVRRALGFA